VAAVYFTERSCLHKIEINFLQLPEPDQNVPYLSPLLRVVPNSAEVHKNMEIPQKRSTSMAWLKIMRSVENCGPCS